MTPVFVRRPDGTIVEHKPNRKWKGGLAEGLPYDPEIPGDYERALEARGLRLPIVSLDREFWITATANAAARFGGELYEQAEFENFRAHCEERDRWIKAGYRFETCELENITDEQPWTDAYRWRFRSPLFFGPVGPYGEITAGRKVNQL